jgi:hypothetical protein
MTLPVNAIDALRERFALTQRLPRGSPSLVGLINAICSIVNEIKVRPLSPRINVMLSTTEIRF